MHIQGRELEALLQEQGARIEVRVDANQRVGLFPLPEALMLVRQLCYIGVTNRAGRLFYIRPRGREWVAHRGKSTLRRIRNDAGVIIAAKPHYEHRPVV